VIHQHGAVFNPEVVASANAAALLGGRALSTAAAPSAPNIVIINKSVRSSQARVLRDDD
jgi:hypothetical protein